MASLNDASKGAKVVPEDLTEGFRALGLQEGDSVMLHGSLEGFGTVDGGAAMVLHKLLGAIGKKGTLLMPAFTRVTTHANSHDNHTKPGCWCEGHENRHIPFIPELQPDKEIGDIAHRLCSWPASRRSRHPSYSVVGVGYHCDELVRAHPLIDPLYPIRKMLAYHPSVLMAGVGFNSVTSIHLAEERRKSSKLIRERALTVSSEGPTWVEVAGLGCSNGFEKVKSHLSREICKETIIGNARVQLYPMHSMVEVAGSLLDDDSDGLTCDNKACMSCMRVPG